ncbi:MAG TPA: putative selenate reductase subunit YgfK [Myxococcales bacterium]|nr:putative selenate reductase subunit YgfK [Myxococcales bacterium]
MEKPFRPIPLETLARWIFRDLDGQPTVLGIPRDNFQVPDPKMALTRMGRSFAAPLGVAAGPHTQLAQNIVAAWLAGARFIELKTVQTLDELNVSKPCIDSEDATFNCEWSQELQLDQSFDEYLKAWVLLHAIAHKLGLKDPGVFFSMSVGYDLAGIQGEKVQRFLRRMRDAKAELPAAIEAVAQAYPAVKELPIAAELSNQITLSTMHGCPPTEIEKIASYLLTELGVHTWVKLNPTLLGPERLREILNKKCGFDITVPDVAFEHDPGWEDAMAMVRNLAATAKGREQSFGLKLSNTLEVVNTRTVFPANEKMMYMSGRSLHPLTLNLAHLVTEELDGQVPISFCGGADALNYPELVADGLSPVTVSTDLLKPGGYARLQQYLVNLDAQMTRLGAGSLDELAEKTAGEHKDGARGNLRRHAARVFGDKRFLTRDRPMATKGSRALGRFDCIAAPCQEGCPTNQNVPDYLWLVANGRPNEAADVILRTNALPGVTGCICDHPCMDRCVRNHYDAPLAIREVKRFAIENGTPAARKAGEKLDVRVAIVGAGPAGLGAAYYLALAGFGVTVFEARRELGGMPGGLIPPFRMGREPLAADVARIEALGVEIKLGVEIGKDLTLTQLREQGFKYTFIGVGAAAGKKLGIPGEDAAGVLDALAYLEKAKAEGKMELGQHVLIVGGGNSAMDAARSSRRFVKDGTVDLVYRRTRAQMPAAPEEIEACVEEGIGLRDLLAPERVQVENGKVTGLVCGVMKLGAPDASGRPRPEPTGEQLTLPCSTLIAAIGQDTVLGMLEGHKVERNRNGTLKVDASFETTEPGLFAGGDLVRGPASIIKAAADGRRFAEALAKRHGVEVAPEPILAKNEKTEALLARKARKTSPQTVPVLPLDQRGGFEVVHGKLSAEAAVAEADRCLDCDELCSLCVTVCPNRANQAYVTRPLSLELPSLVARGGKLVAEGSKPFAVTQSVQTINVGDSCNECGNCATFCPTADAPYKQKPRFWLDREGFETAKGDAFHMVREGDELRLEATLDGARHSLVRNGATAEYRGPKAVVTLKPESWEIVETAAAGELTEGEAVDLTACATLIALLAAEPAVVFAK